MRTADGTAGRAVRHRPQSLPARLTVAAAADTHYPIPC